MRPPMDVCPGCSALYITLSPPPSVACSACDFLILFFSRARHPRDHWPLVALLTNWPTGILSAHISVRQLRRLSLCTPPSSSKLFCCCFHRIFPSIIAH